MAYQIQKYCDPSNVEHVIYEKNVDVGGTWLENRYPGTIVRMKQPVVGQLTQSEAAVATFLATPILSTLPSIPIGHASFPTPPTFTSTPEK